MLSGLSWTDDVAARSRSTVRADNDAILELNGHNGSPKINLARLQSIHIDRIHRRRAVG